VQKDGLELDIHHLQNTDKTHRSNGYTSRIDGVVGIASLKSIERKNCPKNWYRNLEFGLSRHGYVKLGAEFKWLARSYLTGTYDYIQEGPESNTAKGHLERPYRHIRRGYDPIPGLTDIVIVGRDRPQTVESELLLEHIRDLAEFSNDPEIQRMYNDADDGKKIKSARLIQEMNVAVVVLEELLPQLVRWRDELVEYKTGI
jgi:hypothetical protein